MGHHLMMTSTVNPAKGISHAVMPFPRRYVCNMQIKSGMSLCWYTIALGVGKQHCSSAAPPEP